MQQMLSILACEGFGSAPVVHRLDEAFRLALPVGLTLVFGCFAAFYAMRFGWRVLLRRPPMPACASPSDPPGC